MGGVKISAVLSAALAFVWLGASASASEIDGVRGLAREKAAAVEILKTKAADAVVTLAQDRLFIAYLNATTQGEGARLRLRIAQALGTLANRFGLGGAVLIDRSGEVVVRAGASNSAGSAKLDVRVSPVLGAGFAQAPRQITSTIQRNDGGWAISHVAAINWHGQNEFVLRAEQTGSVYQRVITSRVSGQRYVVLVDDDGRVLSDSRPGPTGKAPFAVAGFSLAALRRAVNGNAQEGSGDVSRRDEHLNVSYRSVGSWTVIAVEPAASPRRCVKNGGRLCG